MGIKAKSILTYAHFGGIIAKKEEVKKMFDDRLKNLRLARGLSQTQVANDLGMPQKTYCNYERNEREPNSTALIKLATYFGVTLDYLLDYHCEKKSPSPIIDERETYAKMLSNLSDSELIELKKFTSYLRWKREHKDE